MDKPSYVKISAVYEIDLYCLRDFRKKEQVDFDKSSLDVLVDLTNPQWPSPSPLKGAVKGTSTGSAHLVSTRQVGARQAYWQIAEEVRQHISQRSTLSACR